MIRYAHKRSLFSLLTYLDTDEKPLCGWRPALGQAVPHRPGWTLEQKLGNGTVGEVWMARQERTKIYRVYKFCFDVERFRVLKRRQIALQFIRDHLADRDEIAPLLDVQLDQPPFFLESEYVPAGDLRQWVEKQRGLRLIPLATRLQLFVGVARAVAAGHSLGVIHSNLKPSNILIVEKYRQPCPRVADFGIGLLTDGRPQRLSCHEFTRWYATSFQSISSACPWPRR